MSQYLFLASAACFYFMAFGFPALLVAVAGRLTMRSLRRRKEREDYYRRRAMPRREMYASRRCARETEAAFSEIVRSSLPRRRPSVRRGRTRRTVRRTRSHSPVVT